MPTFFASAPDGARRRRRPTARARLLLVAAILAAAAADADAADTPKTVLKPTFVRFIEKRGTTVLPKASSSSSSSSSSSALSASAAAGGNSTAAPLDLAANFRNFGPRPLPASALRQAARTTAAHGHPRPNNNGGGNGAPSGKVKRAWPALNAYETMTALFGTATGPSFEPPDHALAVGNGFVVESINTVLRVYDKTGKPRSPVVDLTVLHGLPPLVPSPEGCSFLSDPTILWDTVLRRWFQVVLRAEVTDDCKSFTGRTFLEIAVSVTASPLGSWATYTIETTNNGQGGSPVIAGCETGCLSDFPRPQLDASSLVITANIFPSLVDGFIGAEIYVLDKFALARGAQKVAVAEFAPIVAGEWDSNAPTYMISPAYTPPPAPKKSSPHAKNKKGNHGSNNDASDEAFLLLARSLADTQRLLHFALTGTRALKRATDQQGLEALINALELSVSPVMVPDPIPEILGLLSPQPRQGNFPLGESLGKTEPGWAAAPPYGVQSSAVAQGRHYAVLNFPATAEAVPPISILLVQLNATTGALLRTDVLGEPGESYIFPAVAVGRTGKGGVVVTAASIDKLYPSVAYFAIGGKDGDVGARQIALEGRGLQDGKTQYVSPDPANPDYIRPRMGDFSAAVIDEDGLFWGAAQYVPVMSCTLDEWYADTTCSGTRAAGTNWATGITSVKVG